MTDLEMQRHAAVLLLNACQSVALRNNDDSCATRLQKGIADLLESHSPWEKAREIFREETADWPRGEVVTALINARDLAVDESEEGWGADRLIATLEIVALPEDLDRSPMPDAE